MGKSIRDAMTGTPRKVDFVGIVTDRDIVTRVVAEGKDAQAATVGEIASKDLVTVDPQQEDGRLVGILAQADVAREGEDSKTGRLVEQKSD